MPTRHPAALILFGAVMGALITAMLFIAFKGGSDEPISVAVEEAEDEASSETDEWDAGTSSAIKKFTRDIKGSCKLYGIVKTLDDAPVADALVRLRLTDEPWAAPIPPNQIKTDKNGRFEIGGINGDLPFVVWAFKPGYAVASETDIDCNSEMMLVLEKGASLTVVIADAPTGPVNLQLGSSALWPPRAVRIKGGESVTIDGLAAGDYALSVWTRKASYLTRMPVTLEPGKKERLEVELSESETSTIRVSSAADKAPLKAKLAIHPLEQPLLKQVLATSEEGVAKLRGPARTRYAAVITSPGFVDGSAASFNSGETVEVSLKSGNTVSGVVTTKQGDPVRGAELEVVQEVGDGFVPLQATDGRDFQRGLISAAVQGWPELVALKEEGRYTVGPLRIPLPTPIGKEAVRADQMAWRPTDQYGRFTLEGLTTGRVSIRAEHPEYVMVKPADLVLESGHPVADAVVLMKPGQTVTLRVLDNDGFPIPDASVSVYDFDGRLIRDEVCAPDGYAELKGLPRSVRIEVSKEGYVAAAKTHHGKTGAAVDVVMKLGRADKLLRGRVKDARGFGVGGVAIVARAMGRGLLHVLTGVTESDGAFVLEGAGDGGYHVTADGAEKGRAQVLDADYHREIKMVLDLSEGLPGPPLLAPESELGGLGGDLTLGAENLHQADNLGMTAGPGDTDSEAETPIYTQFGEAHDLPVTGPPPGKGGLPITLGGGPGNVTVSGVAIGSRVGGAGLTKGCKILSIDGNKVSGPKEARRALEGPIGSVVMLEVEENGEVFTIVVQRERVRAQ